MRTPIILAAALSLAALSTPAFAKHHHHKHSKAVSTEMAPAGGSSASQPSSDMRGPGTVGSSGGSAGPATGTGSGTANPTATGGQPGGNNSKN